MLLCTDIAKPRSRAPYCYEKRGERPVRRTILPCVTVTLAALWMVCCSAVWRAEAASDTFPAPYGPLRLVNQQPVQLLFLQPFPDRTDVTPFQHFDVDLNVALTNTLVGDQQDFTANLDLEMVRTVIALRYGVHPNFEVGVALPIIYTYGGILDHFILDVERLLTPGRERPLRKNQDAGAFTYQVSRGDRVFIQGQDDALGIGDIVLQAKAHILHEQAWLPAVSLRAAVKFPSGDADRAFGSGEVDGSVGVLLQKTWWRFTFYVNADVTFPGQAFDDVGVSLHPFFLGLFAIEFRVSRPVSLVLQLRGDTRPFHDTISILDKRILETHLGVNWAISRQLVLQAGLAEDQFNSACCSADVSFFLNLTGRF
jgi:Protein of unknown function (DUF3187)